MARRILTASHHSIVPHFVFFVLHAENSGTWIDGVYLVDGVWSSARVFNADLLDSHIPNAVALCCPGKSKLSYFDADGFITDSQDHTHIYSTERVNVGMFSSAWAGLLTIATKSVGPFSKDLSNPLLAWCCGSNPTLSEDPIMVGVTTDGHTWTKYFLDDTGFPPWWPGPPFFESFLGWVVFGSVAASCHDGSHCYALYHELCTEWSGVWDLGASDRIDKNVVYRVYFDGTWSKKDLGDFYDAKTQGFPMGACCRFGDPNLMYFIVDTGYVKKVNWLAGSGMDSGFVPRSADTYAHGQIMSTHAGTLLFAEFNIAGAEGYIIRSTDGSTWNEIDVSASVPSHSYAPYSNVGGNHMVMSEDASSNLLLPLGGGYGLLSQDDGLTWAQITGIGTGGGYIQDADGALA